MDEMVDDEMEEYAGRSWLEFAELINAKSAPEDDVKQPETSSKVETDGMRLKKEDSPMFGFCPSRDEFYLVMCERCQQLVKPQAMLHHIRVRHTQLMIKDNGNTVYGIVKDHTTKASSSTTVPSSVKDSATIAKQTAAVKKALAALKGRSVAALRQKNGSASATTIERSSTSIQSSTCSSSAGSSQPTSSYNSKPSLPSSPATSRCSRPSSPANSCDSRANSPVIGRFSRPASPTSSRCSPMTGRRDILVAPKVSSLCGDTLPVRRDSGGSGLGLMRSSTVPVLSSQVPARNSPALMRNSPSSARSSPVPLLHSSLTSVRYSPSSSQASFKSVSFTPVKQEFTSNNSRIVDVKPLLDIDTRPRSNHFVVTKSGRLASVTVNTEIKTEPIERLQTGLESSVDHVKLVAVVDEPVLDRVKDEKIEDEVINANMGDSSLPLLELEDDFLRYWDMPTQDVLSLSMGPSFDSVATGYDGISMLSEQPTVGVRSTSHHITAPLRPPDTIPPPRTHHILLRPPDTIPAARTSHTAYDVVTPSRSNSVLPTLRPTSSVGSSQRVNPIVSLRSPLVHHQSYSIRPPSVASVAGREFTVGSSLSDTSNVCDNNASTLLRNSSNELLSATNVAERTNHNIVNVKASVHDVVNRSAMPVGHLIQRVNASSSSSALSFTIASGTECTPLRSPVVVMSSLSRQSLAAASVSSGGSSVRSLLTTGTSAASLSGATIRPSVPPTMQSALSRSVLSSTPSRPSGTQISRGKTGPSQMAVTIHIPDGPSRTSKPPTIVVQRVEESVTPATVSITTQVVSAAASVATSKKRKGGLKQAFLACKDREYDPDQHCGVWIEATQKQCTRSFTCKTHALSLRRAVSGRSQSFDELLRAQRKLKEAARQAALSNKLSSSDTPLDAAPTPSGSKQREATEISTSASTKLHGGLSTSSANNSPDRALSISNLAAQRQIAGPGREKFFSVAARTLPFAPVPAGVVARSTSDAVERISSVAPQPAVLEAGSSKMTTGGPSSSSASYLSERLSRSASVDVATNPAISLAALNTRRVSSDARSNDITPVLNLARPTRLPIFSKAQLISVCETACGGPNEGVERKKSELLKTGGARESGEERVNQESCVFNNDLLTRECRSSLSHHPQPIAINSFGTWCHGRSTYVLNRREDNYHAAFYAAVERSLEGPPRKKQCLATSSSNSRDIPVLSSGNSSSSNRDRLVSPKDKQQATSSANNKTSMPSLFNIHEESIVATTPNDTIDTTITNGQWNGIGVVLTNRGVGLTPSSNKSGGVRTPAVKSTSVMSPTVVQSSKPAAVRRTAPPVQRTLSEQSQRSAITSPTSTLAKRPSALLTTPDRNSVDQSKRIRLVSAVASSSDSVFTIRNSHVLSRLGNNGRVGVTNSSSSAARSLKDDLSCLPLVSPTDSIIEQFINGVGGGEVMDSNGEVTTPSDDIQHLGGGTLEDLMRLLHEDYNVPPASNVSRTVQHHPTTLTTTVKAEFKGSSSSKNGRTSPSAAVIVTSLGGDIGRLNGAHSSLSSDPPCHSPEGVVQSPPAFSKLENIYLTSASSRQQNGVISRHNSSSTVKCSSNVPRNHTVSTTSNLGCTSTKNINPITGSRVLR